MVQSIPYLVLAAPKFVWGREIGQTLIGRSDSALPTQGGYPGALEQAGYYCEVTQDCLVVLLAISPIIVAVKSQHSDPTATISNS